MGSSTQRVKKISEELLYDMIFMQYFMQFSVLILKIAVLAFTDSLFWPLVTYEQYPSYIQS